MDAYGDKAKNKLMINTVLCPPYSSSKMTAIKSFFKAQTWLPAEMQKKYAYVERGTLLKEDTDYTLYPYSDSELNNIPRRKEKIAIWRWIIILMILSEFTTGCFCRSHIQ